MNFELLINNLLRDGYKRPCSDFVVLSVLLDFPVARYVVNFLWYNILFWNTKIFSVCECVTLFHVIQYFPWDKSQEISENNNRYTTNNDQHVSDSCVFLSTPLTQRETFMWKYVERFICWICCLPKVFQIGWRVHTKLTKTFYTHTHTHTPFDLYRLTPKTFSKVFQKHQRHPIPCVRPKIK